MTVLNGNGVTFKKLAVNGISAKTICRRIEPTTVRITNGLSIRDSLKTVLFSLRQFKTLILINDVFPN